MLPQSLEKLRIAYPDCYSAQTWTILGSAGGFSGAEIFRLETAVGPMCLRAWPRDSLPRVRLLGLHRLLKQAFAMGATQIAVPILTKMGESLLNINGRDWQLEPWMPGVADFWSTPSQNRLKNTMAALAGFHQATQFYEDAGPARAWFFHQEQSASPALQERLKLLRNWQTAKCDQLQHAVTLEKRLELREIGSEMLSGFAVAAGLIGQQLELLRNVPFRLQPCWRDLWHDHVLFSGDEVTGLIDPSAIRAEHVAADLARLLGSLLMDDQDAWAFAIKEYEQFRPLDANERALIAVLDHSGVLLSGMNWLDRLILQNEPVANFADVMERLSKIHMRLKNLATTQNRLSF